jgi:stage V sporulation protein B
MVLATAGLISKVLGVLYRIPFARLVGAEGMGLYQMAYPIYTMVLAVATAGFPVAISVLISEKKARGDALGIRKVFRLSLILLSSTGLLMSWMLFRMSGYLADHVLHDSRAAYSLAFIAPAIFLAGVMSVFRGYFQGQQWMFPTALSQIIEQLIRVGTVLFAAWWLLPRGLEFAAAGATFGAVTGGLAGLFVLLIIYFGFKPVHSGSALSLNSLDEGSLSLLKRLMILAFPIAMGALVMPVVQTLDALIVPQRLQQAGYTMQEATELFGQLSGMAGTLINLPGVITIALATSLVPAISAASAQLLDSLPQPFG